MGKTERMLILIILLFIAVSVFLISLRRYQYGTVGKIHWPISHDTWTGKAHVIQFKKRGEKKTTVDKPDLSFLPDQSADTSFLPDQHTSGFIPKKQYQHQRDLPKDLKPNEQ